MKYNDLTRRYFESAAGAGVLAAPGALRGAAGSRAQGTWVQFDVLVDTNSRNGAIQAVRFLAFACPHVIAVSAWVAEQAVGQAARAGVAGRRAVAARALWGTRGEAGALADRRGCVDCGRGGVFAVQRARAMSRGEKLR